MKIKPTLQALAALSALALPSVLHATAPAFPEGEISLSITRGERLTEQRYLKKDNTLRIDVPGVHVPAKPINFIDLTSGDLRILRPHNATWVEIPAARLNPSQPSAFPQPPKFTGGARPMPPGTSGQRSASTPPLPLGVGPQPSDSALSAPKIPAMPTPKLPDGSPLPVGIGPQSQPANQGGAPPQGIPQIPQGIPGGSTTPFTPPAMPAMGGMGDGSMTLTAHPEETRTLHGYPCVKHTLRIPRQGVMTLWLSDAADLPPFHTLAYEAPRSTGQAHWQQRWPALLREKKSFPLLAILRTAPETDHSDQKESAEASPPPLGEEIMRWEVSAITAATIDDEEEKLFKVPAEFHKMSPLPF